MAKAWSFSSLGNPYNAPVQERARILAPLGFLLLLMVVFYPSLFLNRVLAPQALLWNVPPWSQLGGPNPTEQKALEEPVRTLVPRLALVQRYGWRVALWNPFVGGGRPGFLALGAEGIGPLALGASLLFSPPYQFNGLLLLHLALAFWGVYLLARRYLDPQGALLAGFVYALSGPVLSSWLTAAGSAMALGPWLWLAALSPTSWWAPVPLALCILSGGSCWPYVVGFLALAAWACQAHGWRLTKAFRLFWLATGAVVLALPSLYLAWFGVEKPGAWWLQAKAQPRPNFASLFLPAEELPLGRPWVFVGAVTLLLAALGASKLLPLQKMALWALALSLPLVFAPASWLPSFVGAFRPSGILALGVALLAGAGSQHLLALLPPGGRLWPTAGILAALLLRLVPAQASWLLWESRQRAQLPSPWTGELGQAQEPVLPLLTLLPPDTAALLGLADLRAGSLAGEPLYRSLLRPGADGVVTFSRIADPLLADLGALWLLEPAELSLVSAELFSKLQLDLASRQDGEFVLSVPPRATRLGLKIPGQPPFLQVVREDQRWILKPDKALAEENAGWHFYLIPSPMPAGRARLLSPSPLPATSLTLAWDCSGWDLEGERGTLRLWRQRFARPLAAWMDDGVPPPMVLSWQPGKLLLRTQREKAGELVLRLKFRPALLRLFVDGKPLPAEKGPGVWTTVKVPAGEHVVRAQWALPPGVLWAPLVGVFFLVLGRRLRL